MLIIEGEREGVGKMNAASSYIIESGGTHLMAWTGRVFGLANLRFNCDGSVTYFSAFCRRLRKPALYIFVV